MHAHSGGCPSQEMNFKTLLARAVYNAVFHPPKVNVVEMFQPRRTAFVFDLDDSESGLDIPTTLRRSKADCPKAWLTMRLPCFIPSLHGLPCHVPPSGEPHFSCPMLSSGRIHARACRRL